MITRYICRVIFYLHFFNIEISFVVVPFLVCTYVRCSFGTAQQQQQLQVDESAND